METTTLNFINEGVITILYPVIVALLGFLSTKLIAFINSKTESVKKNIKNETVKTYIDVVSNTVGEVVQALNQEIVNGIKEASKDGKLTEDEANTMYDYAALAKDNSVSPDLLEYIMETDNVRVALRKAKNLGMDDEDWMDVIKMLEEKEKEAKK